MNLLVGAAESWGCIAEGEGGLLRMGLEGFSKWLFRHQTPQGPMLWVTGLIHGILLKFGEVSSLI